MPWTHRITEIEGRPAQILIDESFKSSAPVRELPRLAWFGVYCQRPPGPAFWDPDESEQLDALEDDLLSLCGQSGRDCSTYVLRIATPGIREYYIYIGNGVDFAQVLPCLLARHPAYRIEHDETEDPTWKRYSSCLPA